MSPLSPEQNVEEPLIETTVDGPKTSRWVLEVGQCPALAVHRMARLGIDEAVEPYQRVRLQPGGSFIMVCISGTGRVLLDGRWHHLGAGWACMAPPRVPNAFQALPGKPWRFCWVRFDEPSYVTPCVSAFSPVKVRVDTEQWLRLWEGLCSEHISSGDPKLIYHWLELLHHHVRRLAEPWRKDDRLRGLWLMIEQRLAEDWTLTSLAKEAHMSEEHFRRLCWRELGRSPMAHLTALRMDAAKRLLTSTADKQEAIAQNVGYHSAMAFSRAFKRWASCSPSEYRSRA